ncbi:TPA: hypothetical protein EYO12_03200 [Candidatus Saccharibacteria bacterium]|nr:hypothetical protein [Candidatus Saccharibacteria bacterium]HIO87960.1 hypothetical protein [Candidatus Saccharibacteria bacterium]
MFLELKSQADVVRQFFYNRMTALFIWGILGELYSVVLFVLSGSLTLVFLDKLVIACATMVGITVANVLLRKKGYGVVWVYGRYLRTVLIFISILIWPLLEQDPFTWFWVLSVMRGIDSGFYHTSSHYVAVKEMKSKQRSYIFQVSGSYETIMSVFLPLIIGFLLDFVVGYRAFLIVAALLSFLSLFKTYQNNTIPPKAPLLSKSFLNSLKNHPEWKRFLRIYFIDTLQDELQSHFWKIAPFLILGSIFGYGVFVSGVALIAAIVVYVRRHVELKGNLRLGYYLHSIRVAATLGLVASWQAPALIGRAVIEKGAQTIEKPIDDDLDISLREAVLGSDVQRNTLQLNYLLEVIKFSTRLVGLGFFIGLIHILDNSELFLRTVWAIVTFGGLATYWLQVKLWKTIQPAN